MDPNKDKPGLENDTDKHKVDDDKKESQSQQHQDGDGDAAVDEQDPSKSSKEIDHAPPAPPPDGDPDGNENAESKEADGDDQPKPDDDPNPTADDAGDGVEKSETETEEQPTETVEEQQPTHLPPDLRLVSLEIDEYISSLSSPPISDEPQDESSKPPAADESPKPPADESPEAPADESSEPPADESPKPPAHESSEPPAGDSPKPPAEESAQPPADDSPEESPKPPVEAVPICVEHFAILFDEKLDEYDTTESPVKWNQLSDVESDTFLEAVHRVSRLYAAISQHSSNFLYSYSINRIGGVLHRAMAYLEEEFRSLMEDYKIPDITESTTTPPQDPPESEPPQEPPAPPAESEKEQQQQQELPVPTEKTDDDHPSPPPPEAEKSDEGLSSLRKIAKAMVAGGYDPECWQVYFVARRNALEENLNKFGFEKHSVDDVLKMNWESLEKEIAAWIETFKHYATFEFPRERKLSDSVFPDYPRISEALFCSLSKAIILQLVNFSEAVAMTKRAAEKLFRFIDIYETLRDVPMAVDNLFPAEAGEDIKSQAIMARCRLGEAMISIFCELENSIKADTGKTPVPNGAVHPLTRYTVNYVKYVGEYKETLEQVFRDHQKIERADSGVGSDYDYTSQQNQNVINNSSNSNNNQTAHVSPFQAQVTKVMDLLDTNLDAKSKLYKDISLSSIFMMNNGRYILQKVRGSPEISSLMGDNWCRKRSSDLRTYHRNYQRETWGKLLSVLINHEGLYVNGKVIKPVLKERFKSFNAMFDEIHRTQSAWVVSDEQLQSELRVSISNMVIPAYRAFLARYGQTLTPGRQTEKYVKYQPEDIETYVDELFDGNAVPAGRRR